MFYESKYWYSAKDCHHHNVVVIIIIIVAVVIIIIVITPSPSSSLWLLSSLSLLSSLLSLLLSSSLLSLSLFSLLLLSLLTLSYHHQFIFILMGYLYLVSMFWYEYSLTFTFQLLVHVSWVGFKLTRLCIAHEINAESRTSCRVRFKFTSWLDLFPRVPRI